MLPENWMERMGDLAALGQRLVLSSRCSLSCAKNLMHSALNLDGQLAVPAYSYNIETV